MSEVETIEAIASVVQLYFDGLYEGDIAKLSRAFHPTARLYSLDGDSVRETPRDQWLEIVKNRATPKSAGLLRTDRILALDVDGSLASVKVELSIHPKYFVDRLTLLHVPGRGFQIVAKVFLTTVEENRVTRAVAAT